MMALVALQTKAHCYPFPAVLCIGRAFSSGTRKITLDSYWKETHSFYKDGFANWCTREDIEKRCIKKCTELVLKNPNLIRKVKSNFLKRVPKFNRLVKEIEGKDIKKLPDKEIYGLWRRFSDSYLDAYTWSEPFAFFTKDSLAEYLLNYLVRKTGNMEDACSFLNVMVSPVKISFIKREETDMLRIAARIKKHPKDRKLKEGLIGRHTGKWSWTPYDYGVMMWGRKHFLNELDDILKNKDPEKELKKTKDYFINLKKEQKKIIRGLDIDRRHQELFEDVRTCAFIMDYKKEIFTKSHIAIRPLLKETSKRLKISFLAVQFIMWGELKAALLKGKKFDNKRLEARKKMCYMHFCGKSIKLYEGKAAKRKFEWIKRSIKKVGKEIKGICASPGTYKGRVRIILDARQINRVKKGEILVTNMTSPDYTLGMKRAGAIITNEGGITCHAAIVSREMGIPCVIGTRVATKVFKDGDFVEVDAEKGIVKILR